MLRLLISQYKWTPLMWCLENKHFEIAKLLLKHQVDIQDKVHVHVGEDAMTKQL